MIFSRQQIHLPSSLLKDFSEWIKQWGLIYGDSKYTRLYQKDRDIVEDENFPLHREFMAAKETLAMLKEKYRQKRNTNWITNFH